MLSLYKSMCELSCLKNNFLSLTVIRIGKQQRTHRNLLPVFAKEHISFNARLLPILLLVTLISFLYLLS
jgi:hypothetical protein